jgi:O-antigen/teichoic acid export membrane protein
VASVLAALIVPVTNVAYPRLSELVALGDETALANQYHKFAQLLSVGVLPPAIILCLFSREIILLWTGDVAMAAAVAPLLSIWVIGTALNGLMHIPYVAQLAHGWPQLAMRMNALAVVAVIPALLILVPKHGAIAAAWIWVAINAAYLVFGVTAMHRRILRAEKWKWYGQDVLMPLAAGLFVAALMLFLHANSPDLNRLEELAFLVATGLALGLTMALAVPCGRKLILSAVHLVSSQATHPSRP